MTDKTPEMPTGYERMKRIPPRDLELRPKRYEFDPKKAYQKKQLAELGAISIIWNQVETQIDYLGSHILFMPSNLWVKAELSNVVSMTGKIALIRTCLEHAHILDDDAKKTIEISLQGVVEHRKYRNAVIHHQVYDHKKGIGSFIAENGKPYQVMITYEALSGLYRRLELLVKEVTSISGLLMLEVSPPGFVRVMDPKTGKPDTDQPKALRERAVPAATKEVLRHQQDRLSLPPLPLFPDARRVRPKKAAVKTRRRRAEKGRAE
jgi:hypothetical protein